MNAASDIQNARVPSRNAYLYVCVFVSGMVTLAIELSASRLLGSVFGTSNLVWANVIGLMLLYLTVGYFIGGRWADRSPRYETFFNIMVWGAFLSAFIPLLSRPVLRAAGTAVVGAEAALAIGSFVSVLVLFAIPVTLLGCISPFAIRLAINNTEDAGRISGQIYAISTLGSLLGTFLPVLILIPTIGTFRTFILFAAVLYVIATLGLFRYAGMRKAVRWAWMPVLITLLSLWALNGPFRSPTGDSVILFEGESGYNFIQVQENPNGYRELMLNEGLGVHSRWHATDYKYDGTWDLFLAAPYFNGPPFGMSDVHRLLVIGLAAGTIPRQYTHVYGDVPIDGVEIDPIIVDVGATYFDMNSEEIPNLNVFVEDGRYVLNRLDEKYTVVAIDAYRPPYIPWHLTTVEFFQELAELLEPNGVVAINVGRTTKDRRLVDAMARTMLAVFPTVHAIDVPRSFNTILVATRLPTTPDNLIRNRANLNASTPELLQYALDTSIQSLVPTTPGQIVFTDDRAAVEQIVDSLTLNFLLNGEMEDIR